MKRLLFILLLLCFCIIAKAGPIVVFFNNVSFYSPVEGSYTEVHIKIPVSTLCFEKSEKGYIAGADIEIEILGDKDTAYSDRYILPTPLLKDTFNVDFNLVDIRRARIKEGHYVVNIKVRDHKTGSKAEISKPLNIIVNDKIADFSDIILVDTFYISPAENVFTRGEIDYIPEINNFYGKDKEQFSFYAELYNADNILGAEDAQLRTYISDVSGKRLAGFSKTKAIHPQKVSVITDGFSIRDLPAGVYTLTLELRGNTGNMVAQKSVGFYRIMSPFEMNQDLQKGNSFGLLNARQISNFLEFLAPISGKDEAAVANEVKKKSDTAAIREYFVRFWTKRDPKEPYKTMMEYLDRVNYVQSVYKSGFTQGYKTDRGAAVLRYGKPDYIAPYIDEVGAYPYEIWQYYKLKAQSNVRFVFYNPTGINNDYILLHSDAFGETKNPNWKQYIYHKINKDYNPEHNNTPDIYGTHADDRIKE